MGGGRAKCSRIGGVASHHATLWAVMAVVPSVQPTIKSARMRTSDAAGRRAILVPGIACSSKNVLCRCGDDHRRVTSLQLCHIRRLAILAKESRWCLGLLERPSKMRWKCRLPRAGPRVPVVFATFGFFSLLLATIRGRLGRRSCCPGKRRRAGFGHRVRDERAEKCEKYRYSLLVYRGVRGKEAWQLLPEHGAALDGFEEHLEVSVRVFPVSTRHELD
jgi:hypothetical protein